MRTLSSVLGNSQRLDGGAMFGNAPRPIWAKWIPPDEQNRIPLACRALLVKDGALAPDFDDEIVTGSCLLRDGREHVVQQPAPPPAAVGPTETQVLPEAGGGA